MGTWNPGPGPTSGNDEFIGGPSDEHVDAGAGNDTLRGSPFLDYLVANAGNDLLYGNGGNDYLYGDAGSDTIYGGAGDDSIYDGDFSSADVNDADQWFGEGGNDFLFYQGGGSQAAAGVFRPILDGGAGSDTVRLSFYFYTQAITFSLSGTAVTIGGVVQPGSVRNFEILSIEGGAAGDSFSGGAGNDYFVGYGGNDMLNGGSGADTLYGSAGADTMAGGNGNDVYYVENVNDIVTEYAGGGYDVIHTSVVLDTSLYPNIESFLYEPFIEGTSGNDSINGGSGTSRLVGHAGDDTITGSPAQDFISGGAGNDSLSGSDGDDIIVGGDVNLVFSDHTASANFQSYYLAGAGYDTIDGGAGHDQLFIGLANETGDIALSNGILRVNRVSVGSYTSIESLGFFSGSGDDSLVGGLGTDFFYAGDGDDFIDGGPEPAEVTVYSINDGFWGGRGNDTYIVRSEQDAVYENLNEGADEIRTTMSTWHGSTFVLAANVENLTYIGSSTINGAGNELANRITGGAGNDVLDGRAGDDTIDGAGGVDHVTYYSASGAVSANLLTGTATGDGNDTLISIEYLTGSVFNDSLTGGIDANSLSGGAGSDTLDGGAGADTLIGGAGDDLYIVDATADVTSETSSANGYDRVQSSISWTLGAYIERLTLTGSADLSGTGNGQANLIEGNSGRNILDGGIGADTMIGGAGGDTYYVDNTTDVTTELMNEGSDRVFSSVNRTLSANIENLTLTGGANIAGAGNALNNVINGNSGNNTLNGNLGADTLTGGLGQDQFLFNSAIGGGNVDRITDFYVPDDTLVLENGIFTALAMNGALNSGSFRKGAGAADSNDFIIYQVSTGALYYDADGNGAGAQVQIATLNPNLALTAQDFLVI